MTVVLLILISYSWLIRMVTGGKGSMTAGVCFGKHTPQTPLPSNSRTAMIYKFKYLEILSVCKVLRQWERMGKAIRFFELSQA